ncbi:MAG TPA: hypothetical protein VFM77_08235 [Terriglobales bacterium]|nr:hypothetical protein [Terriglobales bacterium]
MENQKDKKYFCGEDEVQFEIAENLINKSSVTEAESVPCTL